MIKAAEISFRSMNMIEERFARLLGSPVWVPDWNKEDRPIYSECSHVLLMGNFYKRIFQKEHWPKNKFKLYCLSSAVKEVLCELFFFESDHISVVPRYGLFPLAKDLSDFPQGPMNLIHAGRISPQKNIEFMVLVSFYLQVLASAQIQLTLFGNFDNEYHHNATDFKWRDYKEKIEQLISSLPWPGRAPLFYQDLGTDQWCQRLPERSVLFSTSTLISEDLGVALAQAQELGLPLLVPFWGGLKEIKGENVRFYPSSMIVPSHGEIKSAALAARELALRIKDNQMMTSAGQIKRSVLSHPKEIELSYLDVIYQKSKDRWGPCIDHIVKDEFHLFMKDDRAAEFFSEFNAIFSRPTKS